MSGIKEHNQFFIEYFCHLIKFVEENCLDRIEGTILFSCYLDSLSGYRWPTLGNRERFEKFILTYSTEESTWIKISLPKYMKQLQVQNPELLNSLDRLFRKVGVINNEYLRQGYNPDCTILELEKQADGVILTPFSDELKKDINGYRYIDILWKEYRNLAIHETRTHKDEAPGLWEDMDVPFYVHVHKGFEDKEGEPRFKIPSIFILRTLKNCLNGFAGYLDEQQIDIIQLASQKRI
ncbi:MAG: hypothetical protein R3F48_04200 [Candidatus Zixiibacteriota bacterium]